MGNDIAFQPLRVAVVSNSGSQRALLRDVIERNGSQVVHISGFKEYVQNAAQHQPDVLLIDLDAADDDSLNTLDVLVDQDEIPILFNDGVSVDISSVFAKTDWEHNLMNKLYQIAGVDARPAATPIPPMVHEGMSQIQTNPAQTNVAAKNTTIADDNSKENKNRLPAVAVFSHSKTRRSALKTLLINNGLDDVTGYEFRIVNLKKTVGNKQLLLIDKHNVGPEESSVFNELTIQLKTPFIICNSSEIPLGTRQRNRWGRDLVQQLIETAKSEQDRDPEFASNSKDVQIEKSSSDTNSITTSATLGDEHPWIVDDWGNKLAASLAGVRDNLRLIEAKKVRHQLDKLIQAKNMENPDQAEITDEKIGLDASDPHQSQKYQDQEFSNNDIVFFESANEYDEQLDPSNTNIENDNVQRFTELARYFSAEHDQSDRIGAELRSDLTDIENEFPGQQTRINSSNNHPESGKQSAPKNGLINADQDLARSKYENKLSEDNIPLLEEQALSDFEFQNEFELYKEEETLFEEIPEIDNIKESQNILSKSSPFAGQPKTNSGKAMAPHKFYLDFDPNESNNNIYSLLAKWRSTIKDWRQQISRLFG